MAPIPPRGHGWGQGTRPHSPWCHCRFHLAATRGNVDCLEAMLAHGVDAMTKDSAGEDVVNATQGHWLSPGVEDEGTEVVATPGGL